MPLPTNFDPKSRVSLLWREMISAAADNGRSSQSFEDSVNRGYLTGYYPEPVRRANDPTKIEPAEVLEFAYSDPAYYRLLAKHGFPVPFAMDDYNDETKTDKKWRDEIIGKLDGIRNKLRDERVMREGADNFNSELARRIYDYILSFHPRNIEDCRPETVDWDALEKKCGFCSEASSILYFAYQHAGLKPFFMESFESEPMLRNYFVSENLPRYSGAHVYVGVPLEGKGLIEADVAMRRFGKHEPFARKMTERRFAGAHLINLEADMTNGRGGSYLSGQIFDILPDDQMSALGVVISEFKTMTPLQLISRINWFMGLFDDSPRRDYHVTEIRYMYAAAQKQHSGSDILGALRELVRIDPRGSTMDVYLAISGTLGNLEAMKANAATDDDRKKIGAKIADTKRNLAKIVESSVRGNPYYMPMINLLEQVEAERHTPEQRIELYGGLIRSYPKHNIFRYLLANECADLIRDKVVRHRSVDDIDSVRDEALRHIKELIRSEPDQPKPHFLMSQLALYTRDDAAALAEGKRALELSIDGWVANGTFLKHLILVGIHSGDSDFLNAVLPRLQKDWPKESAQRLREIIGNEWSGYYTSADGRPLSRPELDVRINLVRNIMRALAEGHEDASSMDFMRWRQGGALALAFGAPVDAAKPFFDEIENKASEEMQKRFETYLASADKNMGGVDGRMLEANSTDMGLNRIRLIESYLVPERKVRAIPTYLKLAVLAFDCDRDDVGSEAIEAAIRIDPEKAADDFMVGVFEPRMDAVVTGNVLDRLMPLLDPLWKNSGLLPDAALHRLEDEYSRLANKLESAGDTNGANFCRERASHLMRICPR